MQTQRGHRDEPELVRGTLSTFRRRCGKPGCRCVTGDLHESPALTYWQDGRTKTLTLRHEVAAVEHASGVTQAKAELEDAADKGLECLRRRRTARRPAPQPKRSFRARRPRGRPPRAPESVGTQRDLFAHH